MEDNKSGKLTPRQQAFADYYIELGNATEAAKRAGYSKKTAGVIGDENLRKPNIKAYIDLRLAKMSEERIATAEEVLQTLTRMLRRENKETVVVTCKIRTSSYDKQGRKEIVEKEEPKLIEIPTRNVDVNKAAELLGKRYGLYTDKVDVSGGVDLRIQVDYGDDQSTGQ